MENLLEEIYKGSEVPYWGEAIPVGVVRSLIDRAELRATCNALDVIEGLIDGYGKLGWLEQANALNLAYQRINEGEQK